MSLNFFVNEHIIGLRMFWDLGNGRLSAPLIKYPSFGPFESFYMSIFSFFWAIYFYFQVLICWISTYWTGMQAYPCIERKIQSRFCWKLWAFGLYQWWQFVRLIWNWICYPVFSQDTCIWFIVHGRKLFCYGCSTS